MGHPIVLTCGNCGHLTETHTDPAHRRRLSSSHVAQLKPGVCKVVCPACGHAGIVNFNGGSHGEEKAGNGPRQVPVQQQGKAGGQGQGHR